MAMDTEERIARLERWVRQQNRDLHIICWVAPIGIAICLALATAAFAGSP